MWKKRNLFIMSCLIAIFSMVFAGCSGMFQPRPLQQGDLCFGEEAAESLVCKVTSNDPRKLDSLLLGVNMIALEKDAYAAAEALKVIDQILGFLSMGDGGITYSMVVAEVIKRTENAGALHIVLSPYLEEFDKQIPVSPYDLKMFITHLTKQKALIFMYSSRISVTASITGTEFLYIL